LTNPHGLKEIKSGNVDELFLMSCG